MGKHEMIIPHNVIAFHVLRLFLHIMCIITSIDEVQAGGLNALSGSGQQDR